MGHSRFGYGICLYRKGVAAVISALIITSFVPAFAQIARRRPANKGPRALGLIELATNGKAHLVPITIMIDGKFYDAAAYKADPVPMALQSQTVYEGLKSGVSQGLFTVAGTLHEKDAWLADGKWRSAVEIEADKARAKASAVKKTQKAVSDQETSGPPKLKRAPDSSSQTSSASPASHPPSNPAAPSSTGNTTSAEKVSSPAPSYDDPNRPVLRRQAPSETTHEQTKANTKSEPLKGPTTLTKGPIELIPAISDADGPEPRPYTYQLKPEEEQNFLKKMLAMAAEEVKARAAQLGAVPEPGKTKPAHARPAQAPQFQDVQLRIFDLSTTNEPVLVLTATATVTGPRTDLQYMTTLVTREDIYGDLHKAFAQTTDSQHLDALPKYELIDAVDADGDGRGELLFRTTWDSASAFSVYRVIGDRLWPLFEGKPGT
jgi:hypothetical protein